MSLNNDIVIVMHASGSKDQNIICLDIVKYSNTSFNEIIIIFLPLYHIRVILGLDDNTFFSDSLML